jgi:hypothetical protein
MSDAVIGALIGGACALAGGLLGATLIVWFESRRSRRRARRDLEAALTAVINEMIQTQAALEEFSKGAGHPEAHRLDTARFAENSLVLARELQPFEYASLQSTYNEVAPMQHRADEWARTRGLSPETRMEFAMAAKEFRKKVTALVEYARSHGLLKSWFKNGPPPKE